MSRGLVQGLALALLAALLASPLLAHTIFLKDGTQIVAKELHRIEGDRVIITLPNGTETFIALEEVDTERTREFNANNLDGAVLLEGGETKGVPTAMPEEANTLGHLIIADEAQPRIREPVRRAKAVEPTGPAHSEAGFLDFGSLERSAYADLAIVSDLRSYFTSQGLETQIFSGSRATHPLVEVTTNSEAAVFKSLQVAAQALPQLRDRHSGRIAGLELLLRTSNGTAAGQFVMTPELAASLNSGEVEVATFFVREVQF